MTTIAYLYLWIHLPSKKWYLGSKSAKGCHPLQHETYICSSKIVKPLIELNRTEWHYEIIVTGDPAYIRKLETKFLSILDAKNNENSFNRSNACFDPGNRIGRKETLETRHKKSLARRGKKNPSWGKKGNSSPLYGRTHSEQTKRKQSEKLKEYNKNRPDSHNKNISKALTGNQKLKDRMSGSNNPMYGKPASENSKLMSKLKNSGENNPMRRPENQKECEHCKRTVAKNHYTMYHGDKCKERLVESTVCLR